MKLALYYDRLSRFLRDEKPETISAPTLWLADVILYFVFGLARRIFFSFESYFTYGQQTSLRFFKILRTYFKE